MLKRILRWFFYKDHGKASAAILSTFDTIKADLIKLNESIAKTRHTNTVKLTELQIHNAELDQIAAKNSKVAANLSTLLGDEPAK